VSSAEAFLQAILADPDADGPRLVFADWLDEHGDPVRAEFIRTQIALTRMSEDDDRRPRLKTRERQLLDANLDDWLGEARAAFRDPTIRGLAQPPGGTHAWENLLPGYRGVRFERGFVEGVGLRIAALVDHAATLFSRWPIREVSAGDWMSRKEGPRELREYGESLASLPGLDRLDKLAVFNLSARDAGYLLASPQLAGLRDLSLSVRDQPGGMAALQGSSLRRLERLHYGPLDADDVRALADWPGLAGLRGLSLSWSVLNSGSIEALLAGGRAEGLTSLRLSLGGSGSAEARAIARSDRLVGLTELDLSVNSLGDEGVSLLAGSPYLRHLRVLNLSQTGCGRAGIRALARSPVLEGVAVLDLTQNAFGPSGLAELVASPGVSAVRELSVPADWTGHTALALAQSPYLRNLRKLRLGQARGEASAFEALARSPNLANLRELTLEKLGLNDEAARALSNWPGLGRLNALVLARYLVGTGGVDVLAASPHIGSAGVVYLRGNQSFTKAGAAAFRAAGLSNFCIA
jgi:uncharacterized protein (TIGR02996 family)